MSVYKRRIDSKYHAECDDPYEKVRLVKTSNDQEIPETEPTFLFRGRDRLALRALEAYHAYCIADGCLPSHLESLDAMIEEFRFWAEQHPEQMKQPGITRGL